MELVEIKGGFQMDAGAPCPTIISNESVLYIAFYVQDIDLTKNEIDRPINYSESVVLQFKLCIKYSFGLPNDETLSGHPYYHKGLRPYCFFEVKNSPWLLGIQEIEKVHPYYNSAKWLNYKHYILTFHDSMFECIADSYTHTVAFTALDQLSIAHLSDLFTKDS